MSVEYILPAVAVASSIFMAYSTYRMSRRLKTDVKPVVKIKPQPRKGYVARLKELELRRGMLKNAIVNVMKEFDEGRLSNELKEKLISEFRRELEAIEAEIQSIKYYAELEELEEEYSRLIKEYEERRKRLEKRIRELRKSIGISEKRKEVEKKSMEKRPREEYSLEELMNEITKVMKDLEGE